MEVKFNRRTVIILAIVAVVLVTALVTGNSEFAETLLDKVPWDSLIGGE
ncbi:hypothetical protein LCGC14_1575850 [marine sediment metagenome]|uniref:Uncharacterized protein n=1 Tax=marine sediment metagenome TaxID=412755 RepID=A0A0F9IIA8_9ZZZZ